MNKSIIPKFLLLFLMAGIFYGCQSDKPPLNGNTGSNELIFQSGYEDSFGMPAEAHVSIRGADGSFSEKNDWEEDLLGHPKINSAFIYYEGGDVNQRFAKIIDDPNDLSNKILHFWLDDTYIPYGKNKHKGRVQVSIHTNGISGVIIKNQMYLPEDMQALKQTDKTFYWLTFQEFWNDPVDSDYPFRITLDVIKPTPSPELYFRVRGQTKLSNQEAWESVWEATDSSFPIPIEEWFTIESTFIEGNNDTGRFIFIVTDNNGLQYQVIDITNYTHHPNDPSPDGLNNFNPLKLYSTENIITPMRANGKTLQFYWDDFELWFRNSS